jgi:hypothetical protein
MTDHNPISPLNLVPEELLDKWEEDWHHAKVKHIELVPYIAAMAAQWGADQEILACGNYLKQCAQWEEEDVTEFYNYRRPQPASLKEKAYAAIDKIERSGYPTDDLYTIRRALEQLPDHK